MRRRAFLCGTVAVLAAPFVAGGQQPGKVDRIVVLTEVLPTSPAGHFVVEIPAYGDRTTPIVIGAATTKFLLRCPKVAG